MRCNSEKVVSYCKARFISSVLYIVTQYLDILEICDIYSVALTRGLKLLCDVFFHWLDLISVCYFQRACALYPTDHLWRYTLQPHHLAG